MTDHTNAVYTKIRTQLSCPIEQDAAYHKKQTGQ